MNTDRNDYFDSIEDENPVQIKQLIGKYLRYWPLFLGTVALSLMVASFYLRYADVIYATEANVKIIDDKKNSNFSLDGSRMFGKSAINLENEIALFKSVRLSEQVVRNLNLNIVYTSDGKVKAVKIRNSPFVVRYALPQDSLQTAYNYDITITKSGYTIVDDKTGKFVKTKGYWLNAPITDFPITIQPSLKTNISSFIDENYKVSINPIRATAIGLSKSVGITALGEGSDIITLAVNGTDGKQSEEILNNLIEVFGDDGVQDNQQVSRRTIDFVDDRFVYLRKELDSIEISKKEYKKRNDLIFIEGDASVSIAKKSAKEQALYDSESQLLLAKLVIENIASQSAFELLPANIGIQNGTISELMAEYNSAVLQYQKVKTSAGGNNPSVQVSANALAIQKKNIVNSVRGYMQQLQTTVAQSQAAQKTAQGSFSTLPEKEKVLRSIERQQNLKESLYLLLLQKKEEASINLAVTVPNTKIIDYAITSGGPVSPQNSKIYAIALLIGLFLPFGILLIIFKLDNKIHHASDLESKNRLVPVLAELPTLLDTNESANQSVEAFRTLANNINFITPISENEEGSVIFVCSSIKGEGKTFVSYNLAKAYAQLDKKVIVIGTDFRNPQLHKYIDKARKATKGFSNYLQDPTLQWQDLISTSDVTEFPFDILRAGDIPPNPTLLLSNKRFSLCIAELKKQYDFIIVDTAPTLLVTDALIISKFADTTVYVVRSGLTEKNLISYANKLSVDKKVNNMGYVINGIDFTASYGYNYGYNYGYDYGMESKKLTWFKKIRSLLKGKKE